MNLIFGCATKLSDNSYFLSLKEAIEKNYAQKATVLNVGIPSNQIGYIDDGGKVLGYANANNSSLLFLGMLYQPLPDWSTGSPVDDAHTTAQYLLSRYQLFGIKFLDHIYGQYVIVICHHDENRVVLANEHSGTRVIFYTEIDNSLLFSTNLYSIAEALEDTLEIDRSLEDFMLVYGFLPWSRTVYKNLRCLERGSCFEWHDSKKYLHKTKISDPWQESYGSVDFETMDEDAIVDLLYDAFIQAIQEQATASSDAAVLLGGFDSALVAAGLKQLGKNVETFSFYYKSDEYNQPHTDTLASYLGIKHNWVPITSQLISDGLSNYAFFFNAPSNWPNYLIQTKHLCSVIRERGFYHCYSGDGCDSVFLGYPGTHKRALVFNSLISLPPQIVKTLLRLIERPSLEKRLGHPYRVALNIIRSLGRQKSIREYLTFRIFDELSLKQLRVNKAPKQEMEIEEILQILSSSLIGISPIRIAYLGKSAVSPNKAKIVGSSDSTGVVINSPYLHLGLKNLALNLPEQLCRPQQKNPSSVTGKYILMKMAEKKKLLPKDVIYQKKVAAVDAPIDNWYAGSLRPLLIELVKGLPFYYSERYINALIKIKLAESLYKKFIAPDKVISHAVSLLITYASFTKINNS